MFRPFDCLYIILMTIIFHEHELGDFRKFPYLYHGRLFGILRARARGFFELEFRRHWVGEGKGEGGSDLGFPEGTDKSVFLENPNFVKFTSS